MTGQDERLKPRMPLSVFTAVRSDERVDVEMVTLSELHEIIDINKVDVVHARNVRYDFVNQMYVLVVAGCWLLCVLMCALVTTGRQLYV
jgi:hypothetical protein